jgi:hypothetical protein
MIRRKLFIYWLCAFFIAAFVLSNSHFKSESNDSKYYTDLVVRYQNQNWQNVISPKWGINYWGFDPNTYMRDQFPGQLILGITVSKLGVPAEQALHILEMLFQIGSIFLLVQIARQFISEEKSSVIYYGLLLTPLAFSYNIRANHELGIMFFCLLSLYSGLKLSTSRFWSLLSALSCMMLLMIKGPFFIFGLALTFLGYGFTEKKSNLWNLIFALTLCSLVIILTAYGYESLFFKVTRQSFFLEFYKIQIQQRALLSSHEHSFLVQKIMNFYYYFWHYLAYSLPWGLLALIVTTKNANKKNEKKAELVSFLKSRLSNCLLASAFVFCFMFAMSDRTAGRYVFPAYYIFSAWVILLLLHISQYFKDIHRKINQFGLHFLVPTLWLLAFALHFL